MSSCHLIILSILLIINYSKEELAPVYTPDNDQQSVKNHQELDAKSKSIDDNLQSTRILLPMLTVNSADNQTFNQKSNQNNGNKVRKSHKNQNNRSYNRPKEKKNQLDSLAYNLDNSKKNQLSELNNALLIQLLSKQKSVNNNNQDLLDNKYGSLVSPLATNNNELPLQLLSIYTTESPLANNLLNNDPNQLALQLYLRKLAELAQLQKQQAFLERSANAKTEKQEKPRLQKRVSSNQALTSPSSANLHLANLNQFLQNQQQQPIYTLVQPQPQSSSSQALYLALQQPFPVMSSSPTTNQQQSSQNDQVNSLIETGDRIFAKIKQWSTDVFNPKSSLNRQISEVLGVVSNVALVALVGVPFVGLASLGISQLMMPFSQSTRKSDRNKSSTKQKVTKSEEKKDNNANKDEKTAKSEITHSSQKNTKSLDKKSRLISLIERAGDEFNHLKNLVEIAKNLELAFKKYNVEERECKYRILCEIGSTNQQQQVLIANETYSDQFNISNNLVREGRRSKRQIRRINIEKSFAPEKLISDLSLNTINSPYPLASLKKRIDCLQKESNCSTIYTAKKSNRQAINETFNNSPQNEFAILYERSHHTGEVGGTPTTTQNSENSLRNAIRNFNLDKFLRENHESLFKITALISQWATKLRSSNEEQVGQSTKTDKLFKIITESGKQLENKLKGFLDHLTEFQEVAKENQEINKVRSKMLFNYYPLRAKRASNRFNETVSSNQDEENLDVSGLKFVLNDLMNQLRQEQNQDNLILPLSRIWLSPYLNSYEFGNRHTLDQCKARFFKCSTNFLGLNNGNFARKSDLEIISNSHLKQALRKKPPPLASPVN